jgi:hypothetical protein
MADSRSSTPAQTSRPPSSMDILLEAIQTTAKSSQEAMESSLQMHARDTQEAISFVQSNVREEISSVKADVRDALTEVVSRIERLEASPSPKLAVGLNPGLRSTASDPADVPHHLTIGLGESLGARPKDLALHSNPGIPRRSERLSSKAPISYRELGGRDAWPSQTLRDLNPEATASFPPSIPPSFSTNFGPQQHAATSYEVPEVAQPGMSMGAGVTRL